jgi:hypothetical protein
MIKKSLAIIISLCLFSCSYNPRMIDINLSVSGQENDPNEAIKAEKAHKLPQIIVVDKRQCKRTIGLKKFGKNSVKISNNQNLEKLIKETVKNILISKSLNYNDDKVMEIELVNLRHNATRKFFIGESKTNIEINVRIKGKNDKRKRVSLSSKILDFDNKYFIASTRENDEENVNRIIRSALDQLLADKKILDRLE